jgi:hypothetical protein
MKVFLTSCETGAGAWRHGFLSLQTLAESADRSAHEVVSRAEDAEIIIITDLREEDYFASLRANPLLRRYPDKCFVCDRSDLPIGFVRGIYASPPRVLDHGRYRTGFYLYEVSEWRNPFVSARAAAGVEKDLFFSFVGRNSAHVRSRLLTHDFGRSDVLISDASSLYSHWDRSQSGRADNQRRYVEIAARSRFVLCPRGTGSSSERLFEIMEMGLVPVILSDGWVRPRGPQWHDFSVTVSERDVRQLVPILEEYGERWKEMGDHARQAWLEWFSPPKQFNYVVDSCADIMRTAKLPERQVRRTWPLLTGLERARLLVVEGRSVVRRGAGRIRSAV